MATVALVSGVILGDHTVADVVLVLFVVAAGLESIFAVCLGCKVFAGLMRLGLVPESICADCADISLRLGRSEPSPGRYGRIRVALPPRPGARLVDWFKQASDACFSALLR